MRFPIASSIESRDGSLAKDAKLVNCFVDVEGETSFVVKRPGLRKSVASAAGTGLGMVSWEGNMYHVVGATIFPHNVGLGAAGDAHLVRRIGAATAAEIEATGIDWNFSPTVAVAQDDRWGRTYESYSEDPDLVAKLGAALVEGLQGAKGQAGRLGEGRVIATAKHFFADGGTTQGVDQGDVDGDINALKALHARPYPPAIAAGVRKRSGKPSS